MAVFGSIHHVNTDIIARVSHPLENNISLISIILELELYLFCSVNMNYLFEKVLFFFNSVEVLLVHGPTLSKLDLIWVDMYVVLLRYLQKPMCLPEAFFKGVFVTLYFTTSTLI